MPCSINASNDGTKASFPGLSQNLDVQERGFLGDASEDSSRQSGDVGSMAIVIALRLSQMLVGGEHMCGTAAGKFCVGQVDSRVQHVDIGVDAQMEKSGNNQFLKEFVIGNI